MTAETARAAAFWAGERPGTAWLDAYAQSDARPDRGDVVRALQGLPAWRSLYEIGCHCGPVLAAIQRAFPDAVLSGCDVNAEAVARAQQTWPTVTCGSFPDVTREWPAGAVDVVVSCYALAYLAPEDIAAALEEAARIARVAVVICEPMAWAKDEIARRQAGGFVEWRHPYLALAKLARGLNGWRAAYRSLAYPDNYLSGLIVLERPCPTS